MKKEFITHSPEETIQLAEQFGKLLKAGDVLAYLGDLGAGKTTFTRGLALGLGLKDLVTSPTFALVHVYGKPPLQLCHFDMYRIAGENELETTGFYDYDLSESIFAVEWSENIQNALPEHTIFITLERISD
ncbi:MAG: tRNA (adenosine(37)-N6)-threonylcarbamoyltransferase complex ATPase subunit type 1 TsaE, partial [Oscillospiraceae bacterium]|nr:tRNA (adenosine(37)-N6)-threonylcarbamoyltransferase complex ATPase subunit type 1 TsaE [Oscillospiraceae bacterium]